MDKADVARDYHICESRPTSTVYIVLSEEVGGGDRKRK